MGFGHSSPGESHLTFDDCHFSYNWIGAAAPSLPFLRVGSTSGQYGMDIIGGQITGVAGGFPLVASGAYPNVMFNIDGLRGAILPSAIAGLQAVGFGVLTNDRRFIRINMPNDSRDFRYENLAGVYDWIGSAGYPVLNSTLPNGTGWSIRALWLTPPTMEYGRVFNLPPLTKHFRVAPVPVTATVAFWLKQSSVLTKYNFAARMTYVDTAGETRVVIRTGDDVVTSTDPWSEGSYPSPTYGARKITFSTEGISVKQYTEITMHIMLMGSSPSGSVEEIFVDPEFAL
jgi:hypothetical protein